MARVVGIAAVAAVVLCAAKPAMAVDQVEVRERVGAWSLYCVKGAASPSVADCSIVASTASTNEPAAWAKVAFDYETTAGDSRFDIRTPRIDYVKQGLTLLRDGRTLGRAALTKCNTDTCDTLIDVDQPLLNDVSTAKTISIVYQVADNEAVSIPVHFDDFARAVAQLRQTVGIKDEPLLVSSGDAFEIKVQMMSDPLLDPKANELSWGEPSKDCNGTPGFKVVEMQKNTTISDKDGLLAWLAEVKPCAAQSTFWVTASDGKPAPAGSAVSLASYQVFLAARSTGLKVLLTDSTGRFPQAYTSDLMQ